MASVSDDDLNDAFDEIVLTEDRAAERGYKTGYVDGKEQGEQEGLEFGFKKGFELGLELGRLYVRAETALEQEGNRESRLSKVAGELKKLVDDVPKEGLDKVDLPAILDRIHAKEKLLVSLSGGKGGALKEDLSF